MRRTVLGAGIGLALCLGPAAFAEDIETEFKFAAGLRDLAYYDLAVEQFKSLNWQGQKDPALRNRIAEALVDACLTASGTMAPAEARAYVRTAAEEMAALLKLDHEESLRNRLRLKEGDILLERGRLAFEVHRLQPQGVDLAQAAAEGIAAYAAAMDAFRKAAEGYAVITKRIEAKPDPTDADRRLRDDCRQKEIISTMQVAWAQFRTAQFHKEQKREKDFQDLVQTAVKTFTETSAKHADTVAGLSAMLGKGMCLQALNDHKNALASFDQLLLARPTSDAVVSLRWQAQMEKATSQAALNDFDNAVGALKAMLDGGQLPPALVDAVRMRYAQTLARAADALRADCQKALAEADALQKKGDADSVRRARLLRDQAAPVRERYRGLYDQAIRIARDLVVANSPYASEANLQMGQWMAAGEIVLERSLAEVFAGAENLFATGKFAEAIAAYRRAILIGDMNDANQKRMLHDAWLQMGKAYVEVKDHFAAGLVFEQVPRLFPDSEFAERAAGYAVMLLGGQYKDGKTPFEAELYLEAQTLLVERFPDNDAAKRAAFRVGEVRRAQKQYERAAACYKAIGPTSEFYERASYLAGWCLWQASLEQRDRKDPEAKAAAAALLEAARAQLEGFIAWAVRQPKGTDQAEESRQTWTANSKLTLAEMFLHDTVNEPQRALAALAGFETHAAGQKDMILRARQLRLRAHCAQGTTEGLSAAEADLKLLTTEHSGHPQNWTAARMLGIAYGTLGKQRQQAGAPEAEIKALHARTGEYLDLAIKLNPNQTVQDYASTAVSLFQAGMLPEAIKAFTSLIDRFEKMPEHQAAVLDARAWRGRCYMDAAQWDLALAEHEALVKQSPRVLDFRRRLAQCLEKTRSVEKAAEQWRSVEDTLRMGTPEWFEARYNRVRLNIDLNRQDLAAQLLAAAAVPYPDLGGAEMKKQFTELVRRKFAPEYQGRLAPFFTKAGT